MNNFSYIGTSNVSALNYLKTSLLKQLTYLLIIMSVSAMAQLKNFGTQAKFKPEPNFKYSVYAYYDIIRESGLGFQYQLGNKWNLDASAYLVNKQYSLTGAISQWDYYDLIGYGFSFKPKYFISKTNRFYIGANLAVETLHHDKTWVEYSLGKGDRAYNLEVAKGTAYTLGVTLGSRIIYKKLLVEPFFGFGYVVSNLTHKSYASTIDGLYVKYYAQPISVDNHDYFQLNLGIKLGYAFKKSKKQEAIMAKMESYYLPLAKKTQLKTDSLYAQKGAFNKRKIKVAYRLSKSANSIFLRKYRKYYSDTTKLYHKIDDYFLLIAVMSKMESYYLPLAKKTKLKMDSLYSLKGSFNKKHIKSAYRLSKKANFIFLRKYQKYYNDSTTLYRKIDDYFLLLDEKIKKGTEPSIK